LPSKDQGPAEAPEDETPPAPEPETPSSDVGDTAAAAPPSAASAGDLVTYRVLKKGDGQIYTGRFDRATSTHETYKKGDVVENVPRSIAEELEDRSFVEIQD
jgi:hypothetical protein